MFSRRYFLQIDFLLLGAVILLAGLGLMAVFSASAGAVSTTYFVRQLVWIALGLAACVLIIVVDYRTLTDYAFSLYAFAVLILIGILLFGTEINGNKSWIGIGGFGFQPSELVKVVMLLVLARYLTGVNDKFLKKSDFFLLMALVTIPVVLVTLQGDLGTALLFVPIAVVLLLIGGLKLRILVVAMAVALCLAPAGWMFLKDYQKQRILVTFDPDLDPQGYGYQVRQSKIAIGSGGLTGKGPGQGLQSQLGFVPEVHTDFIFALLAEETGFMGAAAVLLLYLFILMRLLKIAEQARDRAGILLAAGVAAFLFVHILVNVGMTLGILPSIGIPLPLLSYGGSSMVSTFLAIGLALNVHCRRFVHI